MGQHTSNGFAFFAGPGIERADLGERSTLDVTPTILDLLGHEPPPHMAGRSLLDAMTAS